MRILVTGASGFVGSLIVPRLLSEGHQVRALARDPDRARGRIQPGTELIRGDALTGEGLRQALEGVEVAYYLIHSMERSAVDSGRFQERERTAAETFASAAAKFSAAIRSRASKPSR